MTHCAFLIEARVPDVVSKQRQTGMQI